MINTLIVRNLILPRQPLRGDNLVVLSTPRNINPIIIAGPVVQTVPDTGVILISDLEPGTVVRVRVRSWNPVCDLPLRRPRGLLYRVLPNGVLSVLPPRDWRRVIGNGTRKFLARVISNDPTNERIRLSFEDHREKNDCRYEIDLPYREVYRIARLVPQTRSFLTDTAEAVYRFNTHNERQMDRSFFDPKDRFIAVKVVFTL